MKEHTLKLKNISLEVALYLMALELKRKVIIILYLLYLKIMAIQNHIEFIMQKVGFDINIETLTK
jgi:hypothetical protein